MDKPWQVEWTPAPPMPENPNPRFAWDYNVRAKDGRRRVSYRYWPKAVEAALLAAQRGATEIRIRYLHG